VSGQKRRQVREDASRGVFGACPRSEATAAAADDLRHGATTAAVILLAVRAP